MIRYSVTMSEIVSRIEARVPTWIDRARSRTSKIRDAGRYNEASSMWNEVKPIFMAIQHNKCAYCERRLEGADESSGDLRTTTGRVEHDLEHFRPKSLVKAWPDKKHRPHVEIAYEFPTGESAPGYHLLAYDLTNYVVGCKTCNTELKLDYFPIAGARAVGTDDQHLLAAELPYLIYPLGNNDDDPEDLIAFAGVLPVPIGKSEHDYRRGQVTIDFFLLDKRDNLRRERIKVIEHLWFALKMLEDRPESDALYQLASRAIFTLTDETASHASCARSFLRLWQTDREKAMRIAKNARNIVLSR